MKYGPRIYGVGGEQLRERCSLASIYRFKTVNRRNVVAK